MGRSKKAIREKERLAKLNERSLADHKADAASKKHKVAHRKPEQVKFTFCPVRHDA